MYKVVIIDDEPIIVEGIVRMIPWKEYGCKVVETANDGLEGIDIIRKHKPNIVITDIAMPDMDGLTMLAAIHSEFPDIEMSILTGYRDFDFAQRAIELGVRRFLLKPSDMDELEEAIKTMIDALKEKGIKPEKVEKEESEESEASNFIVNNALKYMENNYMMKISLSEVAEKIYISQWHLSKLLNKTLNQNFPEILNNIRIDKAKELLRDPSLRIGNVAEKVGFVDMAHFSRVFKKTAGMSANEFRNTIDSEDIVSRKKNGKKTSQ